MSDPVTLVTQFAFDAESGYDTTAKIKVTRTDDAGQLRLGSPQLRDVPDDIRVALREWLHSEGKEQHA